MEVSPVPGKHYAMWLAVPAAVIAGGPAAAEQATVATPFRGHGEGFYERTATHWGLSGSNWHFRFGGPSQQLPPFGGYRPGGGLSGGSAFQRGGVSGFFHFSAEQGASRTFTSQTPVVTVRSGYGASLRDVSRSPFVTGLVPVVGGYASGPPGPASVPPRYGPPVDNPYNLGGRARDLPADPPTAARAEPAAGAPRSATESVAPVSESTSAPRRDAAFWYHRGRRAEEAGQADLARTCYRLALGEAENPRQREVLKERLAALDEVRETADAVPRR